MKPFKLQTVDRFFERNSDTKWYLKLFYDKDLCFAERERPIDILALCRSATLNYAMIFGKPQTHSSSCAILLTGNKTSVKWERIGSNKKL